MGAIVHNIGSAFRNNWIIEAPGGIVAVDTGSAGDGARFLRRFSKRWRIEHLKYVFLTHAHLDHAGFVKELLNATDATVLLCEPTRAALALGRTTGTHEYRNLLGRLLERMMASPMGAYPAVSDAARLRVVKDGDAVFEDIGIAARAIGLPGHTPDSIGLYLPEADAVFCGDAAMNRPPINANRHTVLIENVKDFQASWDKLIALDPAMLYPGHGRPFPVADLKAYRNHL